MRILRRVISANLRYMGYKVATGRLGCPDQNNLDQLNRVLALIREVPGVARAGRR